MRIIKYEIPHVSSKHNVLAMTDIIEILISTLKMSFFLQKAAR